MQDVLKPWSQSWGRSRNGFATANGSTIAGVAVRVHQRLLGLTAVIWHNDHTGQPVRSLLAYDH